LHALHDNYDADEDLSEDRTQQERDEEDVFMEAVFSTEVWRQTESFVLSNDLYQGTSTDLKAYVTELWMGTYRRGAEDSSSGFEHVFMGEVDGSDLGGFHNWLRFADEEAKGDAEYRGAIVIRDFGGVRVLTIIVA